MLPSQSRGICLFLSTVEFDPISAAIRFETKCDWSHVGFYRLGDQWTFSAMSDGKGVAWRPPNPHAHILLLDYLPSPTNAQLDAQLDAQLNIGVMAAALAAAETQTGAKYDFLDILGIAFGPNWETPGRMICDKLVLWAFEQLHSPLLNMAFIPIEHMTPRDILLSPFLIERKVNG